MGVESICNEVFIIGSIFLKRFFHISSFQNHIYTCIISTFQRKQHIAGQGMVWPEKILLTAFAQRPVPMKISHKLCCNMILRKRSKYNTYGEIFPVFQENLVKTETFPLDKIFLRFM